MTVTVTSDILKNLALPFAESDISWRVGNKSAEGPNQTGQALPFIDNRVVQTTLDTLVGPENWRNAYTEVVADGKLIAVRCALSIRVNGEWVSKEDSAPVTYTADSNHSRELALKGVYSDAMKRAAVQWGLGRYLYSFKAPWVPLNPNGRLMERPSLPAHLLPATNGSAPVEPTRASAQEGASPSPAAPAPEATAAVVTSTPVANLTPAAGAAPASDASAAVADQASDTLPQGLTAEEVTKVQGLLIRLQKMEPIMIRQYVEGPKGMGTMGAVARAFVLKKVAQKEALAQKETQAA